MNVFLLYLISISLLIAIQVSVNVEQTNQQSNQQQFVIINQSTPDHSSDSNWFAAALVAIGIIGVLILMS